MPTSLDLAPAGCCASRPDARAARLARFKREQLIVDYLNRGVSVAEIAAEVGIGEKRMRAVVREILARRMPEAPEEFAAIQMSRLNEALLVAFSAMTNMNLKAVDRVVRIVRELDRYHGRAAALSVSEAEQREDAPLSLGERVSPKATGEGSPRPDDRPEIPPKALEKTESAPGSSAAEETPAATGEGSPRPDDRAEIPLEVLEKTESAPGPRRLAEALAGGTAFRRLAAEAAGFPRPSGSAPPADASLPAIA